MPEGEGETGTPHHRYRDGHRTPRKGEIAPSSSATIHRPGEVAEWLKAAPC